eukprot:363794-Chlamydomonas_euryale.AAC.12
MAAHGAGAGCNDARPALMAAHGAGAGCNDARTALMAAPWLGARPESMCVRPAACLSMTILTLVVVRPVFCFSCVAVEMGCDRGHVRVYDARCRCVCCRVGHMARPSHAMTCL